ncbi:MAG: hypothetical protein V7605_1826, partial [Acidimicrobiaceae bacterium]
RSRGMLHGVTSFQLLATATWGLSQSSSVIPIARNMARAGARAYPSVTSFDILSMTTELTAATPWSRTIYGAADLPVCGGWLYHAG